MACTDNDILYIPGGAANVLANLRAMGVDALLIYPNEGHRPEKNRLMVNTYQVARWDVDDYCEPIDPRTITQAIKDIKPTAIVVADYNKGAIDGPVLTLLDKLADDLKIYVDTKRNPTLYPRSATFFPNQIEYDKFPFEFNQAPRCILKQGAQGMRLLEYGEHQNSVEALSSKPVCVNGAGDTVIAAFVAAELLDRSNPLYYASVAAGIAVNTDKTSFITHSNVMSMSEELERINQE
jgi:bifunctional ADP-heptose synthase (sugar kinase/adenylyltransferase)